MQKTQVLDILNAALKTGGDYSELYFEDTLTKALTLENGVVSKVNTSNVYGCGVRIFKKDKCVYGYTNDVSYKNLLALANKLSDSFEGTQELVVNSLKVQKPKKINPPKFLLYQFQLKDKLLY